MADSAKGQALAPPPKLERDLRSRLLGEYGILIIVVVMAAALSFLQPQYFLSAQNVTNIVRQIGMNALLALGMYLVILTAGIDLSVGSVMALAIMLLAMADQAGWPWPIVILIGPAVGTLIGLINGLGITLLRLPHPFIMTLGTLNTVRGICYLVSDGRPVSGISDPVRFIGIADIPLPFGGEFAVIPVSAILLLVCYFGVAIFLQKVSLGRHIFAVGGNPQAARVSGINVDGVLVFVYATSGFFAGLAALLMAGRTGSGYPEPRHRRRTRRHRCGHHRRGQLFRRPRHNPRRLRRRAGYGAAAQRTQPHGHQRLLATDADRNRHPSRRLDRRAAPEVRQADVIGARRANSDAG